MPLVRVDSRFQVAVPKNIRPVMGLQPGDYVEIALDDGEAIMRRRRSADDFPITDEPLDSLVACSAEGRAWVLHQRQPRGRGPIEETQEGIRQALNEIEEGLDGPTLRTWEEVKAHLDGLKNRSE